MVTAEEVPQVEDRSMLVKRLKPIPVEAVVRGYLAGSGWKENQENRAVCGVPLPEGLRNASKLPRADLHPRGQGGAGRTTRTSATTRWSKSSARTRAADPRDQHRDLRDRGRHRTGKGMIIADTKFEFGLDEAGTLVLMDEVLTPDSSRYWPVEGYEAALAAGTNPPSYDKQFVRDWLEATEINGKPWDKTPPAPRLPAEVIEKTAAKYREALQRLTG